MSLEVRTKTASPAVALPIVKPLNVKLNTVAVPMAAPETLSTTDVWLVLPLKMFSAEMLLAEAKGVTEGKKKFGGYIKVIEPGEMISLSGKNDKIKLTFDLLTMRSVMEMPKVTISDLINSGNNMSL